MDISFKKFLHIINPNRDRKRSVGRFLANHPELKAVWVDRTSHPTHLETILEWSQVENRSHLAIWGGDGTLSRTVQWLYENQKLKDVTLCFVPVGTGNDFCRRLKIGAWRTWVSRFLKNKSHLHQYDVGMVRGNHRTRVFLNNSGFGRSQSALNRARPNPIKDIQDFVPHKIEVEWESGRFHQFETNWSYLGIVFNGPYFNKGLHFDRSIQADDGLLNAFLVPPQSRVALFSRFLLARLGFPLKRSSDIQLDGDHIAIQSDRPLFPQVDGEVFDKAGVKKIEFSLLKKAINVVVPLP